MNLASKVSFIIGGKSFGTAWPGSGSGDIGHGSDSLTSRLGDTSLGSYISDGDLLRSKGEDGMFS